MMLKTVLYIVLIVSFVLVTFFGLGPVFLADGSNAERMLTLAVVIIIYAILILLFRRLLKK
jgi:hypothetical protein